MGTLFEQLSQGQIRPQADYFCANQIANDKTIILSTENVQKVHSRPKFWWFEKRCGNMWCGVAADEGQTCPKSFLIIPSFFLIPINLSTKVGLG